MVDSETVLVLWYGEHTFYKSRCLHRVDLDSQEALIQGHFLSWDNKSGLSLFALQLLERLSINSFACVGELYLLLFDQSRFCLVLHRFAVLGQNFAGLWLARGWRERLHNLFIKEVRLVLVSTNASLLRVTLV